MPRASSSAGWLLGAIAWILIALVATAVVLSLLFRGHLEDGSRAASTPISCSWFRSWIPAPTANSRRIRG